MSTPPTTDGGDWQIGMSLRDWFAGQALSHLSGDVDHNLEWTNCKGEKRVLDPSATPEDDGTKWRKSGTCRQRLAKECYKIADAMIEARDTHESV